MPSATKWNDRSASVFVLSVVTTTAVVVVVSISSVAAEFAAIAARMTIGGSVKAVVKVIV